MSVARTARRRRRQYKIGALDQIFGKRSAPKYGKPKSSSILEQREAKFRTRQKAMMGRKKK